MLKNKLKSQYGMVIINGSSASGKTSIQKEFQEINVSLEELKKREILRNTSPKSHTRSHYFMVHDNIKYDFEIDRDNKSSKEFVLELKNKIIEKNV